MSETDNPLKLLITEHAEAFVTWLLGRPVRQVRILNVEFPAQRAQSDLLFEVIDAEGNLIYLHIELQGRRSQEPTVRPTATADAGLPDADYAARHWRTGAQQTPAAQRCVVCG
ncbi:MAG: hypothetical protein IAE79_14485 [Anaerolinea sp.]|nr:hypothetical protein [Anaerolinea sp.]